MTLPSGGTGARRRSFSNSKIRGAPVTAYVGMVPRGGGIGGFWIISSSCNFVGTRALALVTGAAGVRGCKHHFSISSLFVLRTIDMTMAIFTSPPELLSHHCASVLSLASVSETPASITSTGQSSPRVRHLGLYVESPSLEELDPWYVVLPQPHKLHFGRPITRSLSLISSASAICAVSCSTVGTLTINRSISV
jgi:hypothetical protein